MGDVVGLRDRSNPLEDDELVENLARFADGTLSAAAVKARHHLSDEAWTAMGENDKLVELVEARKLSRIRSGRTKIERAQIEIIDGPPILGRIMRNPDANERHIIDAAKALDALATGGRPEGAPASDRFVITINLGTDTLHFDKSIAIDPNDSSPNDIDAGVLAAIAMDKSTDGDNGGHL